MWLVTDSVFIGLIQAAPLMLATMGFTLIYYLNGFINVAYAENITFGAYFASIFQVFLGLGFFASILPAVLFAGVFSVLTFLLVFRPAAARGVGPTEMIILSVGLSFFFRYGATLLFGNNPYFLENANPQYWTIFGQGITDTQVVALSLVAVVTIGLLLFIYRTRWGEMMRALANNRDLAMASGIVPTKVSVLIWFIAGAAGGLAGIFFGVFALVTPYMGWNMILVIIMLSIVGGIGSVRGALIASLLAGILTAGITLVSQPLYADIVLLILFIAVLRFRWKRA
ncbi:branched-chain amino acid ABC transporter permease [Chelativorans sp. M5D2P16]|uniref:branched-chain amino acid ABC transporter permease n=1 Tax=Chelativorans sp. M5D2P16 TaxID=3095678 RepID=UPI002ACA8036|nr:branched-chain amino acid ABC transporter permease [Chelativorans sp. M5D2P16]MDZ5697451.1 branched-chain amino acid ABC transporter permease [Chelativorans sp. M5D2P16]